MRREPAALLGGEKLAVGYHGSVGGVLCFDRQQPQRGISMVWLLSNLGSSHCARSCVSLLGAWLHWGALKALLISEN